jgi:hypothetical protein
VTSLTGCVSDDCALTSITATLLVVNSRYVSLELSSEEHWLGEGVLGVAWCWFDRLTLGLVRGLVFWLAVGWLAGWLIFASVIFWCRTDEPTVLQLPLFNVVFLQCK